MIQVPGFTLTYAGVRLCGQEHASLTAFLNTPNLRPYKIQQPPLHAGRSAEEVLSIEQLCQRRLDNVRQLKELYEAELLNTLEELRSRHSHSCKQASATGESTLLLT